MHRANGLSTIESAMIKTLGFPILALALIGCATNPVTDRQQMMLLSEQDVIASSYRAYAGLLSDAQSRGRLNTDPALTGRVREIAYRVTPQAARYRPPVFIWQWDVNVVESDDVNAFCMAGGKIIVNSGLISRLQPTDDELAQVIAHEIAHALSEHTREKLSLAIASKLAVAAVSVAGKLPDTSVRGLDALVEVTVRLPNSRELETEADRIGIQLAAMAGYDPRAAVTLWQKLAALNEPRTPVFLSTHPLPSDRISYLGNEAAKFQSVYEEALVLRQRDRAPKAEYRDGQLINSIERAKYDMPKQSN